MFWIQHPLFWILARRTNRAQATSAARKELMMDPMRRRFGSNSGAIRSHTVENPAASQPDARSPFRLHPEERRPLPSESRRRREPSHVQAV